MPASNVNLCEEKIAQGAGQFRQLDANKGGGIQGISTATAARAETLSDALGTRLIPLNAGACGAGL